MHVIIGGAFNGKRAYVENTILDGQLQAVQFLNGTLDVNTEVEVKKIVISNFEQLVAHRYNEDELQVALQVVEQIKGLRSNYELICICTDMSKGVVPIERDSRFIRDCCGRIYQHLCKEATEVTQVWYGLARTLKEHKNEQ